MSASDGVTHPWRKVAVARIEAMMQHGYRRIRWNLVLECGHSTLRPVEGMRGPGWQQSTAPRKLRCAECTDEVGRRVMDFDRSEVS